MIPSILNNSWKVCSLSQEENIKIPFPRKIKTSNYLDNLFTLKFEFSVSEEQINDEFLSTHKLKNLIVTDKYKVVGYAVWGRYYEVISIY